MSIRFKDRLEFTLLINGREFPFDRVNTLDFFHMSCGTQLDIPIVHFKIKDTANWISSKQDLVDGVLIQVILKKDNEQRSFFFRYFTHKEDLGSSGAMYEVDGYMDSVSYWLKSSVEPIVGSSEFAMRTIAARCHLPIQSVPTADSQIWIPANKVDRQFAKFISQHGYVDNNSCMILGFDLQGMLIYKDISSIRASAASFIAAQFAKNAHIVTDFKTINRSGLLNSISGYSDKLVSPSLMQDVPDEFNSVVLSKLSKKAMINSQIHKAIDRSRVLFTPIDVGNIHTNFDLASYQNDRIANTYSYGLDIVTPEVTDVKLLDFVDYTGSQPSESSDRPVSGKYLVVSRAIYIQGINYYEKIGLVRQGINAAATTQV